MSTIRILIVDDDSSARQTTRAHLTRPGFEICEVSSGEAALEQLTHAAFDVILLDAMMPELDGFETCRRIKANPDWEGIPVVMVTALDSQQDRNDGLRAGADDFLTKPINGTELRLRIVAHSKVKAYHSLLDNVLPRSIARRLRTEPGFMADRADNATILFADIVGFVPFAAARSAQEVVSILDQIFSAFDQRSLEGGLEKIKTIGDAYMLAAGLGADEDPADAASRVVAAGIDFFRLISEINTQNGLSLRLRIGVNSGPVIAGVVGQSRLSYDLWGNTVNLASRMESQGLPNHLQISETTHALIGDSFALKPRGPQAIKGGGTVETWLIQAPSAED